MTGVAKTQDQRKERNNYWELRRKQIMERIEKARKGASATARKKEQEENKQREQK